MRNRCEVCERLTGDLPVMKYEEELITNEIETILTDKWENYESPPLAWRKLYYLYGQGDEAVKVAINKVFIILFGVSLVTLLNSMNTSSDEDLL